MKKFYKPVFYDDDIREEVVWCEELYGDRKVLRIDYTFRIETIISVSPKNNLSLEEINELKKELKKVFETTIDKYFEKSKSKTKKKLIKQTKESEDV